jgi:CRP/FNR family cyclic AMP-dependent transcriptional regulator
MVRVLEREPVLGSGLDAAEFSRAQQSCLAEVVTERRGLYNVADQNLGECLLLLDGFALLDTRLGETHRSVEVLGPGDLFSLSPLGLDDFDLGVSMRPIGPMVAARLDSHFYASCAPWPVIAQNLASLATRRTTEASRLLALMHVARLETRLHLILWRHAERWGKVTPAGVRLPYHLSQHDLADLAGARRQSVNQALGELRNRGVISEDPERRLLVLEEPSHPLEKVLGGPREAPNLPEPRASRPIPLKPCVTQCSHQGRSPRMRPSDA